MKAKKIFFQVAELAFIAVALTQWFTPTVRADELIPQFGTTKKTPGWSVTLEATIAKQIQEPGFRLKKKSNGRNSNASKVVDWEKYVKSKLTEESQDIRWLLEQATILSSTMVVITYNSPPPQTAISPASQTWQWKAWCWSNPTPPSLPPPQGGIVNNVPEPATLVSGLIGICLTGLGVLRRRRRQRQSK